MTESRRGLLACGHEPHHMVTVRYCETCSARLPPKTVEGRAKFLIERLTGLDPARIYRITIDDLG